jgi:Arc/MetJ-type ribon-helix-helix transcriptional regulator
MRRATITIPDDLTRAVESYIDAQDAPPSLTAVVQAALRHYLAENGYLRTRRRARRIEPAERGSKSASLLNRSGQSELEDELLAGLASGPPITPDESYWDRKRADLLRRHRKKAATG